MEAKDSRAKSLGAALQIRKNQLGKTFEPGARLVMILASGHVPVVQMKMSESDF